LFLPHFLFGRFSVMACRFLYLIFLHFPSFNPLSWVGGVTFILSLILYLCSFLTLRYMVSHFFLFFLSGRESIGIGFLKETNVFVFPSHRSYRLGCVDGLLRSGGLCRWHTQTYRFTGIQAQHERRNCLRGKNRPPIKKITKTKKVERKF
jgi:hypothetical protein